MKIHSSCEIEDFVETHLCKLCVILRFEAFGTAITRVLPVLPAEIVQASGVWGALLAEILRTLGEPALQ